MKATNPTQEGLVAMGRALLRALEKPGKQLCIDVVNKSDGRKLHFHVLAVRVERKEGAEHEPN